MSRFMCCFIAILLIVSQFQLIEAIRTGHINNNNGLNIEPSPGRKMIVNVAATDLRATPTKLDVNFGENDDQLSQLLYNEPVIVLDDKSNPNFFYVEAVQQQAYNNGTWTGYFGWVNSQHLIRTDDFPSAFNLAVKRDWSPIFNRPCTPYACMESDEIIKVSMGTLLNGIVSPIGWWTVVLPDGTKGWIRASEVRDISNIAQRAIDNDSQLRQELCDQGLNLLGWYYFWGGRSAFSNELFNAQTQLTGVDCSGLVSMIYRTFGLLLPRDASPIFMKSMNVTGGPLALKTGDVLFQAHPAKPDHMYHVMMVVDHQYLMESGYDTPPSVVPLNNGTRIVTYKEKFGFDLAEAVWGQKTPTGNLIYWGSYLPWRQ